MCAICVSAVTLVLRLARRESLKARLILLVFFCTLPLGLAIHSLTPGDLGFLPARWCETDTILDLAFFVFLYTATFFGFILQLYNLADRGFSLRIVMDIDRSPNGCMTVDDVMNEYSEGKGIVWMYQKRIEDLTRLKFVELTTTDVRATVAGRRVAGRFAWLRRFLRVVA